MTHRRKEAMRPPPVWNPEPPPHSQPWAGWVSHHIHGTNQSISDLQQQLESMQDAMDEERIQREAQKNANERLWAPLKKHGKWIGIATLYVALSTIATGRFPTLKEFLEIAKQAAGG